MEPASTPEPTTATTTPPPVPNETSFPVTLQWHLDGRLVGHADRAPGDGPRVTLRSGDDWRQRVNASVLSESARSFVDATDVAADHLAADLRSFLAATDFDSHSVVALQRRVSAGGNRLVLRAVAVVGTPTLAIDVMEYKPGSPLNNAPAHLLLVRVPNRGVEPKTVRVAALREAAPDA